MSVSRRAVLTGAVAGATTALLAGAAGSAEAAGWPVIGAYADLADVQAVQHLLAAAGFMVPFEPYYGPQTALTVRRFQKAKGLAQTGRADGTTLAALCPSLNSGDNKTAVKALRTLLAKHGYWNAGTVVTPTQVSSAYDTQIVRDLRAHLTVRGLPSPTGTVVRAAQWQALFAPRAGGPYYPMLQYGTGAAEWANCGPVSALSCLLHLGVRPAAWDGLAAHRSAAVQNFRYVACGIPNTPVRNGEGTELPDLLRGFQKYGAGLTLGSINDTISLARTGRPTICGGDAFRMPYLKYVSGAVSHWVAVLGVVGSKFIVADPISQTSDDWLHLLTESQLRYYAASNPGYKPGNGKNPPSRNTLIVVPPSGAGVSSRPPTRSY